MKTLTALLALLIATVAHGQAREFVADTTDYLRAPDPMTSPPTTWPILQHCWGAPDHATTDGVLMRFERSGNTGTQYFGGMYARGTGTDAYQDYSKITIITTPDYTNGQWGPVGINVYDGENDADINGEYLDATFEGNVGTYTAGDSGYDFVGTPVFMVGKPGVSINNRPWDGEVGWCAIWHDGADSGLADNYQFSDEQWLELSFGAPPSFVEPNKLADWWPMLEDGDGDTILSKGFAGNDLTDTGTVAAATEGPPTWWPAGGN